MLRSVPGRWRRSPRVMLFANVDRAPPSSSWGIHREMPPRRVTLDDYERRILRAQKLLEERLEEPVTPSELAAAAHFSLHHFHRIFRAQLGETVMQHVRRLRLERAARRMRSSNERLLAIAIDAGYESHEAFTRAFVERFGISPSSYRAQPSTRLAAWERRRDDHPRAEVSVRTLPTRRVAYRRHRGGYATIHDFWARLMSWAGERGLADRPAPFFGLCPDDPEVTAEEHLRFDACVLVGSEFVPDASVVMGEIPGGLYAVGVHVGPFDRLAETYLDVIGRWFPTSGYDLAPEAVVEHYLDDPAKVPPEELRTEVCVRIAE